MAVSSVAFMNSAKEACPAAGNSANAGGMYSGITCSAVTRAPVSLANWIARSTASFDSFEPSVGTSRCLYMRTSFPVDGMGPL